MNKVLDSPALVVSCFLVTMLSGLAATAPAGSPVADAAKRGDADAVRALLEQGADVQTPHADGMSALHWAAQRNDLEIAQVLICAGANLEAATRLGQHTSLHVAAKSGHAPVVRALLESGSNPNAITTSGTTPSPSGSPGWKRPSRGGPAG